MNIVVLSAKTLGSDADLSPLCQFGNTQIHQTTTPSQVIDRIKNATIILTNKVCITAEQMQHAPHLKLICVTATGVNNIDLDAARERGITVCNVSGYSTSSVAQHTFALLLSLLHRTAQYDAYVQQGSYSQHDIFTYLDHPFWEITGKTWGIIGLGNIGTAVAQLATAFGARVIYFSTSGNNTNREYEQTSLETLLSHSDIVSIHAPLNDDTNNMIAAPQLTQMKSHAILINVGRGGIVNEADLAEALDTGMIAGAGLDVFGSEPIAPDNPLLHLQHPQRLKLSPHIAWASQESRARLIGETIKNIRAFT